MVKEAISSGELNELVTIQRPVSVKANGTVTTTWVAHASGIWASIQPLRSYEQADAQAVWPGADYKIKIRYLRGVTGKMRIVDAAGVIYAILGQPRDIGRRHEGIEMTCQSGVKTV